MAKLNLYVVLLTAISIFVTLGLQAQPLEDKLSDWIDVFKGKLGINFPHSVVQTYPWLDPLFSRMKRGYGLYLPLMRSSLVLGLMIISELS